MLTNHTALVFLNFFFGVAWNKESHVGLDRHENEKMMTESYFLRIFVPFMTRVLIFPSYVLLKDVCQGSDVA